MIGMRARLVADETGLDAADLRQADDDSTPRPSVVSQRGWTTTRRRRRRRSGAHTGPDGAQGERAVLAGILSLSAVFRTLGSQRTQSVVAWRSFTDQSGSIPHLGGALGVGYAFESVPTIT